jgi:hypothetical protein
MTLSTGARASKTCCQVARLFKKKGICIFFFFFLEMSAYSVFLFLDMKLLTAPPN